MYLTKTKSGNYIPSDTESHEASKKLMIGTEVKAAAPRNVKFHRKGFALLKLAFENQDTYESMEVYRKIMTIKAGYYDEVMGKDGKHYFIPQSLSFETMSSEKFEKWFNATLDVICEEMKTKPETILAEIESFY